MGDRHAQAIAPHPEVRKLPLLPRYDGGRASATDLMQADEPAADARVVLRLWQSRWRTADGAPFWYGASYREVQVRPNVGNLRQAPQAAGAIAADLARGGLRRLDAGGSAPGQGPQLWACAGG
jgi:hypothetical protein